MASDEKFVSLIASHQLALTAFLRTLLRHHTDVEDVLQETNLVLWRKRKEFDASRTFAAWACKFAHLQTLSYLKTKGRKSCYSLNDEALEQMAELSVKEAEKIDRKGEELQRCLKKLSPSQRELLRSRYQSNVTVNEIAETLGRTPHAISMSLYRLRSLLRECVERALQPEVLS